MHVETQIKAIFGVARQARGSSFYHWDPIWDWGALGYPGVFSAFFFLTRRGQQRWHHARTVLFPETCCACDAPAIRRLDFTPYLRVPFVRLRSNAPVARGLPHCAEHGGLDPAAFVQPCDEGESFAAIRVFGRHRGFLERCLELNRRDGELLPPWVTFPKTSPSRGWNQGTNEYWMMLAWGPYWRGLKPVEKQRYLEHWQAPRAWRQRLLEGPADVDVGA
jgi:hypothetical protein